MGKIDFCHEDEDINYDETKVCTDREEVHAPGNVQEGKEKNALSLLLVYDEADGYEPSSFFSGRKQVIYRPEVLLLCTGRALSAAVLHTGRNYDNK